MPASSAFSLWRPVVAGTILPAPSNEPSFSGPGISDRAGKQHIVRIQPHPASAPRVRRLSVCFAVAFLVAVQSGCVQRRFTIRSNPPGALVYIDDYEIGTTPVSTDFVYYGTRKVRLVKDGYETLTVLQPVPAPWWQIPPLDFVSDNFTPGEIRDQRVLEYQMTPQVAVPIDQVLTRAEGLRRGTATPSGGVQPVESLPPGQPVMAPPVQQLPAPPAAAEPFRFPG